MKNGIATALFLSGLAYIPCIHAQTVPDAGGLKQQIERQQEPQLPGRRAPEPKDLPKAMPETQGTLVTVKEFRFVGSSRLGHEQLAAALREYLNRPLDHHQLQDAAARVADVFREAGWIVRAFLPVQEVTEGKVTIQIVEATLAGVQVQNTTPTRVPVSRVLGVIEAQQPVNQPLSAAALDRGLLLADDLPGVVVAGALREGGQQSATQLVLKAADEPRVDGEVSLSNHGARATGSTQLLATLQANSPFGLTDQWSMTALHSQGNRYLRLGEMVSVGNDGWKIGGSVSHLRYRLVPPEFSALRAKGNADTVGLEVSYPIIRSRSGNLFLLGQLERKSFYNESQGSTVSDYDSVVANAGLAGNYFDGFSGGGSNQFAVFWTRGRLDLDGSPNRQADADSARTHGQFDKWRFSLSRLQTLTPSLGLFAAYNAQLASKNLDSSERFYLGGANGLWAYPTGEGAGSEGQRLTLELRAKLFERVQLTGFHDYGNVRVNRNNSYAGAVEKNKLSYRGVGLGLSWQSKQGTAVKVQWSHRLGDNPDPQPSGKDRDGSLRKNRVWLNLSQQF